MAGGDGVRTWMIGSGRGNECACWVQTCFVRPPRLRKNRLHPVKLQGMCRPLFNGGRGINIQAQAVAGLPVPVGVGRRFIQSQQVRINKT
jgi:hypothetical protein